MAATERMTNYWLVVTSPENLSHDREVLHFSIQGLPIRFRNSLQRMEIGDRVAYYIMTLQRFGATATITGDYVEDHSKLWTDDDEMWPARRPSKPDIVLNDDELIDAKKLVPNLTFIERKEIWGVYLQGSVRQIPEEDFRLIESEMKKVISERVKRDGAPAELRNEVETEADVEAAIMSLPLQTKNVARSLRRNARRNWFMARLQHSNAPQDHS